MCGSCKRLWAGGFTCLLIHHTAARYDRAHRRYDSYSENICLCKRGVQHLSSLAFLFVPSVTGIWNTCPGYSFFCLVQEGYQTPVLVSPFSVSCKRDIKHLSWLFLFLSRARGISDTCPGYSFFCLVQEGYQTPVLVSPFTVLSAHSDTNWLASVCMDLFREYYV
jgi:hypothetical protein